MDSGGLSPHILKHSLDVGGNSARHLRGLFLGKQPAVPIG
jgi:hypothetical protein